VHVIVRLLFAAVGVVLDLDADRCEAESRKGGFLLLAG
jgi:hypothetical protein